MRVKGNMRKKHKEDALVLFFLTFFFLSGGPHYYFFAKASQALTLGLTARKSLIILLAFMGFAPLLVHSASKCRLAATARRIYYLGYSWMGWIFLWFVCIFVTDLYLFLIYLAQQIFPEAVYWVPSPQSSFFASFLLSLAASIYGYFEAGRIRTEKIVLRSSKIPKEIERLKIVQISDVHLGMIVREKRLFRILQEVKRAFPDILISTGDLVDGEVSNHSRVVEFFKALNPRYGKFAIIGNHEFYAGISKAVDFIQNAGFSILRGQGLTVAGLINIAGVDDPAGKIFGHNHRASAKEALSNLPREKFTILLKHRPVLEKNSLGLFDLQISGHTHQGQLFPFRMVTRFFYPYAAGFFKILNHCHLYVSRGSGTWGPPIRFFAPPEVTLFELVPPEIP